jgi:hypothetical protein
LPLRYQENLLYLGSITGLLEKALQRVEALSREEQDAIAAQILETLEDEEAWAASFARNPSCCAHSLGKPSRNTAGVKPTP